jgi:hypothetical protein
MAQQLEKKPVTSMLSGIDDETIKSLMQYFHFEDYDELIAYSIKLGVRLLPKSEKPQDL